MYLLNWLQRTYNQCSKNIDIHILTNLLTLRKLMTELQSDEVKSGDLVGYSNHES